MSVTFRTTKTATIGTGTPTSITIDKPTGLTEGDHMVAWLHKSDGSSTDFTTPSGWSVIGTQIDNNSDSRHSICFFKIASASDAAASNFTFEFGAAGAVVGALMAYTGANSTIDGTNQGTTLDGSASSSGYTQDEDENLLFILVSSSGSGSATSITHGSYAIVNDDPSWTELFDTTVTDDGSSAIGIGGAWASRSALTATGDATATATPNTENIIGSGLLIIGFVEVLPANPAVVAVTGSVQAPSVTGGVLVTPSAITTTGSVQAPTAEENKWRNVQKNSASVTNQSKS